MMDLRTPKGRWTHAAMVLVGALMILGPAFVNGYPLVYSDTGTYLRSAFQGFVPIDRPYWYGVFVRLTSLGGLSLWGVVAAQALLCSYYIVDLVRPRTSSPLYILAVLALLAAFSTVGWYAGQVMSDVFTGIGCLALLRLLNNERSTWSRIFDGLVVIFSCWVHLSNMAIIPGVGVVILLLHRHKAGARMRMAQLVGLVALAWGGLALANLAVSGEAYISRGGHVMFMGRMSESGILHAWLEEHCGSEHYRICAHKDSLPKLAVEFVWDDRSPVYREGGWDSTRAEYSTIIRGTLTEPRYIGKHIAASLASTGDQLTRWVVGDALVSTYYRSTASAPGFMMEHDMRHEMEAYLNSLQNGGKGELDMRWPDRLYQLFMLTCLALGVRVWMRMGRTAEGTQQRKLLVFAVAVILIGSWVCGSLSAADSRYISRDTWVFPLSVLALMLAPKYEHRNTDMSPSPLRRS